MERFSIACAVVFFIVCFFYREPARAVGIIIASGYKYRHYFLFTKSFSYIFKEICIFLAKIQPETGIFVRKPIKYCIMPVQKVQGGYRWGQSGKVYPTKEQAERQGRAIYASGYKEKPAQTKKK
jgi:hypothetical protein